MFESNCFRDATDRNKPISVARDRAHGVSRVGQSNTTQYGHQQLLLQRTPADEHIIFVLAPVSAAETHQRTWGVAFLFQTCRVLLTMTIKLSHLSRALVVRPVRVLI